MSLGDESVSSRQIHLKNWQAKRLERVTPEETLAATMRTLFCCQQHYRLRHHLADQATGSSATRYSPCGAINQRQSPIPPPTAIPTHPPALSLTHLSVFLEAKDSQLTDPL